MGRTLEIDDGAKRLDGLYRRFSRRVRWVARARGVPESSLDDAVHDTFLRIFRKYPQRNESVPLASWVDSIARNVAFTHRRSHARRARRDAAAPRPEPQLEPDEELARKDAWRALQAFLETLDTDQREAFILCDVLKTPAPEVARTTGVKLNTVYSRVRLARRRFAESFGSDPETVRAAMKQERREGKHSRRAMTLLFAELGLSGKIAAATGTGVGVWSVATVVGAVALSAVAMHFASSPPAPQQPAPRSAQDEARPSVSNASASLPLTGRVAPAPSLVAPPATPSTILPSPQRAPTKRSAPAKAGPTPEVAAPQAPDPLEAEVALLSQARAHLGRGRPAEALRLVDLHRTRFPDGALEAQRHGIERDAACATGDERRARDAADALGSSGDRAVCTPRKKVAAP